MISSRYSLVFVVMRITIFWWCVLALIEFGNRPTEVVEYFIENWGYFKVYGYEIAFIAVICGMVTALGLYARKLFRLEHLVPNEFMGLSSTVGKIPLPNPPLPRVANAADRLPIRGRLLTEWLERQTVVEAPKGDGKEGEKTYTPYGKLFLAIWDTYSAHRHYPASHRLGGHGDKRLYEHCHDVAESALLFAEGGWKYSGIYVKKRGRKARLIMEPNSKDSVLNNLDPIIAIAALAHDIGKIMAYEVDSEGLIIENREAESNTLDDDDDRVLHDMLAPRALALMPEFWEVSHRDRLALNMALAHYHHPSAFPLDRYGRLLDERAASIMALLIHADREVSAKEINAAGGPLADELDEVQGDAIFNAFVKIISEFGRINGVGDPAKNSTVQIGQKHSDFIVIKEAPLRALMLRELNWTKEDNSEKYYLTLKLLSVLMDRGLLYTRHGGVDFSAYLPMYRVALYHDKRRTHITDLAPAIVIKHPPATMDELADLGFMAIHPSIAVIKHPTLTHLKSVRDPEKFNEMVRMAFKPQDLEGIDEYLVSDSGASDAADAFVLTSETPPLATQQPSAEPAGEPAATVEGVVDPEQYAPPGDGIFFDADEFPPDDSGIPPEAFLSAEFKLAPQQQPQKKAAPVAIAPVAKRAKGGRLTDFPPEVQQAINGYSKDQASKIKRRSPQPVRRQTQQGDDRPERHRASSEQKRGGGGAQMEQLDEQAADLNRAVSGKNVKSIFGDI